ncbi:hypothetical protein [Prevotella sp.]|uniref:hypothetical protein n=1 Tax=Prevotella sp. TaxID=59823 RepID=UPI002F9372D1
MMVKDKEGEGNVDFLRYLCISQAALGHAKVNFHGTLWHCLCISQAALNFANKEIQGA